MWCKSRSLEERFKLQEAYDVGPILGLNRMMSFYIENDIIKKSHPNLKTVWYATAGWRHEIYRCVIKLKWLLLQESYIFYSRDINIPWIYHRVQVQVVWTPIYWLLNRLFIFQPKIQSKHTFSLQFDFEFLTYGVLVFAMILM